MIYECNEQTPTNSCLKKERCLHFTLHYGRVVQPIWTIFNINLLARISNIFVKFDADLLIIASRRVPKIDMPTDGPTYAELFRI